MDREREKIEHQLELATRVAGSINDETTVKRLRNFAEELRRKLARLMRRPQVRERAYKLWEDAGRPAGRDVEFWLEAERQINARPDNLRKSNATQPTDDCGGSPP